MSARASRSGFSLVELAIVLAIIGILTGISAMIGMNALDSTRRAQTQKKLDAIEDALMAYRTAHERLPCPANPSLANTDTNYGIEAANMGSCTGGTPTVPAANVNAKHSVVEGAIPFKTLGLPEEFMYDGWGRKFAYAVNWYVTAPLAMVGQTLSEPCGISVTDAGGVAGNRSKGAVYALVSFGPDGHGGYLKNGSQMNAHASNADEQANCHCDASLNPQTYNAAYVQKEPTEDQGGPTGSNAFDHLVRFKERWQMMTYEDYYSSGGPVCQPGFRADGLAGYGTGSRGIYVADVNGDGIPDLIIGGNYIYVVFGTKNGFPNPLLLSSLDGHNGFVIHGPGNGIFYGQAQAVGDVNGDGIADILAGDGGALDVIFGQQCGGLWPNACTTPLDPLTTMDGIHGFHIGPYTDGMGNHLLAVGDINGDGVGDIIFDDSAKGWDYVLFGQKCGGLWVGTPCLADPSPPYAPPYDMTLLADGTHGFYLVNRNRWCPRSVEPWRGLRRRMDDDSPPIP